MNDRYEEAVRRLRESERRNAGENPQPLSLEEEAALDKAWLRVADEEKPKRSVPPTPKFPLENDSHSDAE